jgi:hypothetical protein
MNEERHELGEEIERALQVLDSVSTDENDRDVDAAFRTLARLLQQPSPRHDFSNRVMAALRDAPLPEGRKKLRAGHPKPIAGLLGAAAAAAFCAALWAMGVAQFFVARMFLAMVQGGVFAIRLVSFMPQMWKWIGLAVRALTAIIGSTEMLSVLVIITLLNVLTLAALTRVVSSSRVGGS